jgi:eukaryotic-like serine/threonine-protein kinase
MKKPDAPYCPITPLPEYIGPYKILKKIASGGMGEVFLAKDPLCKRHLALKKIRRDKIDHPGLKERFLKEVKIAAQLSHPGIIPIYQIHQEKKEVYYTMPVVEGETLKEILRVQRAHEKGQGEKHPIGSSIPSLMRIFLSTCQAMAYSHSKGILHRDLKPDNIIVGQYGEVLLLDWGLADFVTNEEVLEEYDNDEDIVSSLTRPGKIAGTLSYLPPERIFGGKSSYTCDIYALGVVLYQLLTLRAPFHRKTVKEYKRQIKHETLIEPTERAPYRDIPSQLSKIAKKCLARRADKRYQSVEEILHDLNQYIEGHAEWVPFTSVQVEKKDDWEFHENILLTKHLALTDKTDIMEWVSLMIAKESFSGKIKLETHIHIKEDCSGVGFLLNLSAQTNTSDFCQSSFLIWIGSEKKTGCRLFRSNVERMSNPELFLKTRMSHFICIEKTDYHVKLYIDNILAFDYLSYTPFNVQKFGIILKDDELDIGAILVSTSSPNILVNCLEVPDALLSLGCFKEALYKYRQIAKSFSGRAEGKEALFRAGITLLEKGKKEKNKLKKKCIFDKSLEEFNLFREGTGSPLEYLGKSLVYKATEEIDEELKCLELSLRRFTKHPLIYLVKEQVLFRLHEASYKDKSAAYAFALLALRLIPEAFEKDDHSKLLEHLYKNSEKLKFLPKDLDYTNLCLQLAFFLYKPSILLELFETSSLEAKISALYCLLHLGYRDTVLSLLPQVEGTEIHAHLPTFYKKGFSSLSFLKKAPYSYETRRLFDFFLSQLPYSTRKDGLAMLESLKTLLTEDLSFEERIFFEKRWIESLLYLDKTREASLRLQEIPSLLKEGESSLFYFLKTCLVAKEKGLAKGIELLNRAPETGPPRPPYLIDYYLRASPKEKKDFLEKTFFWEKLHLFEQLQLLYKTAKKETLEKEAQKQIAKLKKNSLL